MRITILCFLFFWTAAHADRFDRAERKCTNRYNNHMEVNTPHSQDSEFMEETKAARRAHFQAVYEQCLADVEAKRTRARAAKAPKPAKVKAPKHDPPSRALPQTNTFTL